MATTEEQLKALKAVGFEPAATEARKRLIISIEGEEGTGKNNLAFTAPSPIAVLSFDVGLEGVVEKFVTGRGMVADTPVPTKEIMVREYSMPITQTADPDFDYAGTWAEFTKMYRAALAARVRTMIWDTATEVHELLRMLRFKRLTQVMPHNYGPVNAEYRGLLREAYDSHTNLILLHKMRPEYVNDKSTGRKERAGFRDTGHNVQVVLKTFREDTEDGSLFSVKVLKCRQNAQINGKVYEGGMCSFPWLAVDVLEGSGLEDWE